MPATLKQAAAKEVAKYEARVAKATFDTPTTPGNLILVVCSAAGALPVGLIGPAGFTLIRTRGLRDLEVAVWYRENAPATTSVQVGFQGLTNRSLMLRAMEYPGVAQTNALDRVAVSSGQSDRPASGSTGVTSQADELVVTIVANQYASTTQFGFAGALAKLFETFSPRTWSRGSNEDWERSRLTVHHAIATSVGNFSLSARLSSARRWVAITITFRGGTSGPARMTSTNAPPVLTTGGSGTLTAFGPLTSTNAPAVLTTGGSGTLFPYDYQYRLNGLVIGDGTPYPVQSWEGLEGWQLRTSDDDQPRSDGALRGVDLQAARQMLCKLNVAGTQDDVEAAMDTLYRALVPQRDSDWDLVFRHPGRPVRLLRCRPVDLVRGLSWRETLVNNQAISLLAVDPRHYGAVVRRVTVPVTPAGTGDVVNVVGATNDGNAPAYPLIRITGPPSGDPVTRIELVNITGDVVFDLALTLAPGGVLLGDMASRVTGSSTVIISLDGQQKYGAWQQPREPFFLAPAPTAEGGVNLLYLRTVPAGAPITCDLEYRDTWSG